MLRWRLFGAAAILIPLLALLYADYAFPLGGHPGLWLFPVVVGAILMATEEVLSLLKNQGHRPVAWTVYGGVLFITLASCAPLYYSFFGHTYPANCPLGKLGLTFSACALCVPLAFGGEMLRYQKPGGVIVNVALALFTIAYLGVSYSFIIWMRYLDELNPSVGIAAIVSLILVVKSSDTGAYAFGRMFGRHKMTPLLSPGKTIEGAIGGVLTACVVSWLYFSYLAPALMGVDKPTGDWRGWLLYGFLLALAGMVGDLSESLLKRDMQQKDSSTWLRGLGGILDVIDSLLIAAPVAYLCWVGGVVR
jgi:phosphatidate cytidylyltransferase